MRRRSKTSHRQATDRHNADRSRTIKREQRRARREAEDNMVEFMRDHQDKRLEVC